VAPAGNVGGVILVRDAGSGFRRASGLSRHRRIGHSMTSSRVSAFPEPKSEVSWDAKTLSNFCSDPPVTLSVILGPSSIGWTGRGRL
jgi:hypothetical protein